MLALSIVTLFGVSLTNFGTQPISSQSPGFLTNPHITSGFHTPININGLFHPVNHPQMTLSSAIQSTHVMSNLQSRLEQMASFSAITLGPLAYNLYKLVHSMQEWKEDGNNCERIKATITNTPGITLRGITRTANIAMGSVQYWVKILEQENEIDSLPLGKSRHFFDLKQQWTAEAKLLYSLTQNKRILEILQCLNDNPSITTQKDICINLDIHRALLSYYIKILKNHNILEHKVKDLSISDAFKEFLS
ncbi:MAG: hypothetical protein ACW97Z_12135 [Candidatus Hodarchaeales archaeon]